MGDNLKYELYQNKLCYHLTILKVSIISIAKGLEVKNKSANKKKNIVRLLFAINLFKEKLSLEYSFILFGSFKKYTVVCASYTYEIDTRAQ